MKNIVRWILLVPMIVIAWYALFIIGMFTYQFTERNFCSQMLESGFCFDERMPKILEVEIYIFVSLSALVVGLTSTAMAPSHKLHTTWITFFIGCIAAILMGKSNYGLVAFTIFTGFIYAVLITRFLRKMANNSFQG